jgi:hypothetical protein
VDFVEWLIVLNCVSGTLNMTANVVRNGHGLFGKPGTPLGCLVSQPRF